MPVRSMSSFPIAFNININHLTRARTITSGIRRAICFESVDLVEIVSLLSLTKFSSGANMQRNLSGPQQEKGTEAPIDESERLKPLPVTSRAAQGPFPPELPTKISGPDLSFLNDDQPDQKHLAVAISKEQFDSRHNNQQGFQTDEDASRELNEACFARENSQHKIRELWKMQGSDENEDGKLATETRRAQFLLDLERAQRNSTIGMNECGRSLSREVIEVSMSHTCRGQTTHRTSLTGYPQAP